MEGEDPRQRAVGAPATALREPTIFVGRKREPVQSAPSYRVCQAKKDCLALLSDAPASTWVIRDSKLLLRSIETWLMIRDDSRARLGYLLLLEPPEHSSVPVLRTLFRDVAGDGPNYRFLPVDEMLEVLGAPTESAQDLFLGGCHDEVTDSIVLVRGNFKRTVVSLSSLREDSDVRPDPQQLGFADFGQTVTLGDYQAASDAILYELDAEFRRRLNARRHCEQQGLGPSLRRLRKQLGLTRGDFGEVSVKTIARIERGETQPSRRTRRIIEGRVGMKFEEILTF